MTAWIISSGMWGGEVAEYVGLLLLEREYCSLTTILSKICVFSFI